MQLGKAIVLYLIINKVNFQLTFMCQRNIGARAAATAGPNHGGEVWFWG